MTLSHPPGGRLLRQACGYLSSQRSPPIGRYQIILLDAHGCEQLAQGCYSTAGRPGLELQPLSHQSDALASRLSSHPLTYFPVKKSVQTLSRGGRSTGMLSRTRSSHSRLVTDDNLRTCSGVELSRDFRSAHSTTGRGSSGTARAPCFFLPAPHTC